MNILITGSCGFIGSNVVLYMMQHTDHNIISIDKLINSGSLLNVPQNKRHKLYIGDVCDYHFVKKVFEIEKPDIVIHGAVSSHISNSKLNSTEFVQTSVIGMHSILEAALKYKPKKILNISIDEVYGKKRGMIPIDEKALLNPVTPYASSKAAADLIGQSYFDTYGIPIITVRSVNNFGPRQYVERFIPKTISNILNNKKTLVYGAGEISRSWIYVKDFYYALVSIIENGTPGQIYNVGAGVTKTNGEIFQIICKILDKNNKNLVEYIKENNGNVDRCSVNWSKIQNLGWKPKYEFEEALKHTVGWYSANKWFWKGI